MTKLQKRWARSRVKAVGLIVPRAWFSGSIASESANDQASGSGRRAESRPAHPGSDWICRVHFDRYDGAEGGDLNFGGLFRQEGNRVSYQNTLVLEEDGQVVGVSLFYDGAKARALDAPLERAAAKKSGRPITVFRRNLLNRSFTWTR